MVTIMELTYMNLIVLMCTSIMLSTYLLKTAKAKLLLLKVIVLAYVSLISSYSSVLLILFFYLITMTNYKEFIVSLCIYYTLINFEKLCIVSLNNDYILYISESEVISVVLLFIIFILVYIAYILLYNKLFYHRYYRNVLLNVGEYLIDGKGYFDSGNMLTCNGVPVVFLSSDEDTFDLDNVAFESVNIKTINAYAKQNVYHGNLKVGMKWYPVLIGFRSTHKKYDVLLNVRLGEGTI
ncbi:MAG: hypothetical protein IKM20_10350 [Erysipelotrichales bacterium]|nr:hypothetical protein [Erysipelotrichales bacterium]